MRLCLIALALLAVSPASAQTDDGPAAPDPRVEAALKALDLTYGVEDNGDYVLDFDFDDGRGQTVWVRPTVARFDSLAMREVFSLAYTPSDSGAVVVENLAMRLLEVNTRLVAGAWCVEDGAIVFIVRIPAGATAGVLKGAIDLAMAVADSLDEEVHDGADVW